MPTGNSKEDKLAKGLAKGGLFLQAGAALSGAIADYYSAKMSKQQLKFDSYISQQNAKYAEMSAQMAQVRGRQRKQGSQLAIAALKGKQRTALAANGVDMSSDSAARLLAGSDLIGEVDALTIDQDTLEEVWNRKREASNLRHQGAAQRASADSISPGTAGLSTLLSGATMVADSWYGYRKTYK